MNFMVVLGRALASSPGASEQGRPQVPWMPLHHRFFSPDRGVRSVMEVYTRIRSSRITTTNAKMVPCNPFHSMVCPPSHILRILCTFCSQKSRPAVSGKLCRRVAGDNSLRTWVFIRGESPLGDETPQNDRLASIPRAFRRWTMNGYRHELSLETCYAKKTLQKGIDKYTWQ